MLEIVLPDFRCCEVVVPRRRIFSVKIWMTALGGGDEQDDDESVVVCSSPLLGERPGCATGCALPANLGNLESPCECAVVDLRGENGSPCSSGECWNAVEERAASACSNSSCTSISTSDTSTEGSTSADLSVDKSSYPLNVNAPAFKEVSSMTPVIITKSIEINNERWKPNVSIVEENVNSIALPPEMLQPFIGADGLYYIPTDFINAPGPFPGQGGPVVLEPIKPLVNGDGVAHHHLPVLMSGPDVAMNPTSVPPIDTPPSDLSAEDLKKMIQLQFEYYFSRENLASDSYLVSQMDSDQYVPISTIAKFNQIKKLTSDTNLIIEALTDSPYVQLDLDKQKVRANMKRCIVILREIPESTPIEDVKALFSHPNCPPWSSFEFAHNDSWYITFDSEEDAKRAYRYLREDVQNFQGRPIMARIKAKTLLSRSVYMPKGASGNTTSAGVSPSSLTEPNAQFQAAMQAQPLASFAATPGVGPGSSIYQQPQSFQYYAAVNTGPLLAGPWIAGSPPNGKTIHPEMRGKSVHKPSTYLPAPAGKSGSMPRSFFPGGKGRHYGRHVPGPNHVPFHERNGLSEPDELRQPSAPFRRPNIPSPPNGNVPSNRRETESRVPRQSQPAKKDRRLEEIPRFQRLRQERVKRSEEATLTKKTDDFNSASLMALDLAPENFPALLSPNSPKEKPMGTSSLKELASNALQRSQFSIDSVDSAETQPSIELTHESSEDESLTNASRLASNSVASVSSQASLHKISYAQMAQKPQPKGSLQGFDDRSLLSPSSLEISSDLLNIDYGEKSAGSSVFGKVEKRKADKVNSPKILHNNSKGNLSSSSVKTGQDGACEGVGKDCVSAASASDGKTLKNSGLRNNGPPSSTQPAHVSASHGRTSEACQGATSSSANSRLSCAVPPPRPLMSQIIQLPESKLRELENQRSPTFSETVRKSFSMDKRSLSSSADESEPCKPEPSKPEPSKPKPSAVGDRTQDPFAEKSSGPADSERHSDEERK